MLGYCKRSYEAQRYYSLAERKHWPYEECRKIQSPSRLQIGVLCLLVDSASNKESPVSALSDDPLAGNALLQYCNFPILLKLVSFFKLNFMIM